MSLLRSAGKESLTARKHVRQLFLGAILTNPAGPDTATSHGGDGDGPGRIHSVPIPAAPEEAGPLRGAVHHGGTAGEVTSIASSQRKRPRSGGIEASATSSKSRLERWLRTGGNSQGAGQVDTPSRRLYHPHPDGSHRVDDVQRGGELREHHTGPRGGGRAMEPLAHQRAGQDQPNAETHTSHLCLRHS